jgi:hypothetical protein
MEQTFRRTSQGDGTMLEVRRHNAYAVQKPQVAGIACRNVDAAE